MPLRELSADAVRPCTGDAVGTVESAPDFRYFLPHFLSYYEVPGAA
jgi:hypothetical protein